MTLGLQPPPGRWTAPSLLSIALGIAAFCLIVIGLFSHRAAPVLGGVGGLGADFAAVSVGWALDYKVARTPQSWRIRLMQWFFMSVTAALIVSVVVHRAQ